MEIRCEHVEIVPVITKVLGEMNNSGIVNECKSSIPENKSQTENMSQESENAISVEDTVTVATDINVIERVDDIDEHSDIDIYYLEDDELEEHDICSDGVKKEQLTDGTMKLIDTDTVHMEVLINGTETLSSRVLTDVESKSTESYKCYHDYAKSRVSSELTTEAYPQLTSEPSDFTSKPLAKPVADSSSEVTAKSFLGLTEDSVIEVGGKFSPESTSNSFPLLTVESSSKATSTSKSFKLSADLSAEIIMESFKGSDESSHCNKKKQLTDLPSNKQKRKNKHTVSKVTRNHVREMNTTLQSQETETDVEVTTSESCVKTLQSDAEVIEESLEQSNDLECRKSKEYTLQKLNMKNLAKDNYRLRPDTGVIHQSQSGEHADTIEGSMEEVSDTLIIKNGLKVDGTQIEVPSEDDNHKSDQSSVNAKVCEICGKTFATEKIWNSHRRYKHYKGVDVRQYMCELCNYVTPYLSTFKRHKEMHEYRKKKVQDVNNETISAHMCDQCGKCFVSRGSLLTHVKAHTNPQSFQCNMCQKTFSQKGNLKGHLQRHKRQEEKKQAAGGDSTKVNNGRKLQPSSFPCKSCSKVFRWRGDLSRHVKTIHYGIKNFCCSQCGKKFQDVTGLKKHQLNHTGTKPFQCVHCSTCYSSKDNLEQHMLNRHQIQQC